jgi:5'-AMP-activated protein kinase catalytic alpha subunit
MEYCGKGELFDHIVANKRLKEVDAARYYYQLMNGIEYVHRLNIVHRYI